MELFTAPWWSALLAISLIDLVLAGDNAIVIALAARNLPTRLQKKAIVWGTVGAIVVRSAMTVGVVWLLKIPGLMLVGGLGLLWVAYKLLAAPGDSVITQVAHSPLCELTDSLLARYPATTPGIAGCLELRCRYGRRQRAAGCGLGPASCRSKGGKARVGMVFLRP